MTPDERAQLFTFAIEAMHISIQHNGHQGWSMNLGFRRQGETWGARPKVFYAGLTTDELLDVVCGELAVALGLGDP